MCEHFQTLSYFDCLNDCSKHDFELEEMFLICYPPLSLDLWYIVFEMMSLTTLMKYYNSTGFLTKQFFLIFMNTFKRTVETTPFIISTGNDFKIMLGQAFRLLIIMSVKLNFRIRYIDLYGFCYSEALSDDYAKFVMSKVFGGPILIRTLDAVLSGMLKSIHFGRCMKHFSLWILSCPNCLIHRTWFWWRFQHIQEWQGLSSSDVVMKKGRDGLHHFVSMRMTWYEHNLNRRQYIVLGEIRGTGLYDGRVGAPRTVVLDDDSNLTPKPLNSGAIKTETLSPNDSASCVTPNKTDLDAERRFKDFTNSMKDEVMSLISTQIADIKTNNTGKIEKDVIGSYSRFEYDVDLQEAFSRSGLINRNGQIEIIQLPVSGASELVPRITIDDRLNFLIRLHTAIFKIVPNNLDYPPIGISKKFQKLCDGKFKTDHPSFDLLEIVITDTIDWRHGIVKNNNFKLPVLEPGMQINERIIAICLKSLKMDYEVRWRSLVKDCILPIDIQDTSKWSDVHDEDSKRPITGRRADMARNFIDDEKKYYRRKNKKTGSIMSRFLN